MFEDIRKAANTLHNREAGWVDRRDAAEALGRGAALALAALSRHKEDSDVDVRGVVNAALGQAGAGLTGVVPAKTSGPYTIEQLARSLHKPPQRCVEPSQNGYAVKVALDQDREQTVYISPHTRNDGTALVRVFTYCGSPTNDTVGWALRTNAKLTQGALALWEDGNEEKLVLVNCYLADHVTPVEVKASVRELSFYGDWIEKKLSGLDDF